MTGASGIFTPLPGAFLYSQYHFWNAEAKSGWTRGFYLAAQVWTLAGALKSIPVTASSKLPFAAFGVALLAGAVREYAEAAKVYFHRSQENNQRTDNKLTNFCKTFDNYSHKTFQVCFVAATALTLYNERERGIAPLAIGLVSIVADRLWFGKTTISPISTNTLSQRVQECFRSIFVALSSPLSTTLLLVDDLFFSYDKERETLTALQGILDAAKAEVERKITNRLCGILAVYYLSGIRSVIDFLLTPPNIVITTTQKATLEYLKKNLEVEGYLLFGYFAVIEEALSFNPEKSGV